MADAKTDEYLLSKPREREGWYWSMSDDGDSGCYGPFATRDEAAEEMWGDGFGRDTYEDMIAEGEVTATKEEFLAGWEWISHMGAGPISTDIFDADYVLETFEEKNEECVWQDSPPDWPQAAKRELEKMLGDALFRWTEKHGLWKEFRALS